MLLGRERERQSIDRLLASAAAEGGGALVLRGEAGIGKTALLDHATDRAVELGLRVLTASGVEREAELPFAGLSGLVGPVLDRLDEVPEPQAAALRSALALGPPAPGDRFAAAAATLSLLAVAAEERPLLAVVDDAHWLDAASADALSFTARRLGRDRVAMLFAVRADEPTSFDPSGLEQLEVAGLSQADSRALLTKSPSSSPQVVERLVNTLRGNPLALLEAARSLTEEELARSTPPDQPLALGATLERAFLRRVRELPDETQRLLLLAAVSGTETMDVLGRAAAALDLDPRGFEHAETAGILEIRSQRVAWRHPLVRSSVYHNAAPAERRWVHGVLAEVLRGGRASDRRARHLAAAAVGPDEQVAKELEEAAFDARRRGGTAASASTFECAATLTHDGESRARRLLEAARDLQAAGQPARALELVDDAVERTTDPLLRADLQRVRGWTDMWMGAPEAAYRSLVTEAERVERASPERATIMLLDASVACTMRGDVAGALATGARACEMAPAGSLEHALATAAFASPLALAGEVQRARDSLERAREVFHGGEPLELVGLVQAAGHVSVWLEEYSEARRVFERVIEAGRASGTPGLLGYPLACLSELDFRTGRWAAAYAAASESLDLAVEVGQTNESAFSLVTLARVEAGRGAVEDCRAHASRGLEIARALDIGSVSDYGHSVLGFLELGLGRPEAAIAELEATAALLEAQGGLVEPAVVQWAPDHILACWRLGRVREAATALEVLEGRAESTGGTWALAATARCHGLLAGEHDFEQHFERALGWHERTPTPFPRALTQLCFGERLRRARRPTDARPRLRAALETFDRLGAEPWSAQARGELAAAGERPISRPGPGLHELTSQELQVALLVASGSTNKEASAALFLSPKTIEFHLGKAYRKLGLRSRTELARLVATTEPISPTPSGPAPRRP